MFATLFGIPLGLALLTSRHQLTARVALALLLIAFSAWSLLGAKPPELKKESWFWLGLCGFTAGILGGAYGMNGPPLVIYGGMRRWSAQHFRATLQAYFLPASILGMAGYWFKGLWNPAVTHYFLISLPAAIPAIVLGRVLNERLQGDSFLRYVYSGLALSGIALLIQAIGWK